MWGSNYSSRAELEGVGLREGEGEGEEAEDGRPSWLVQLIEGGGARF